MTVARLEEEMSASELLEWIEYFREEPAQACPMLGGGAASSDGGQSPEQQEAILRMMAERER
jgi:hypothetical protein